MLEAPSYNRFIRVGVPVLCALLSSACAFQSDPTAEPCEFSVSIQYPEGLLHSQPCLADSDCLYGLCLVTDAVAPFGFCTKECACGANSVCSDENGAGWEFVCQQLAGTDYSDEPKTSFCTQVCTTEADCPPQYNACERLTGSRTVCLSR